MARLGSCEPASSMVGASRSRSRTHRPPGPAEAAEVAGPAVVVRAAVAPVVGVPVAAAAARAAMPTVPASP